MVPTQAVLGAQCAVGPARAELHTPVLTWYGCGLWAVHAGMRFAGADTTVKLRQDTSYIISIITQPAVAVT